MPEEGRLGMYRGWPEERPDLGDADSREDSDRSDDRGASTLPEDPRGGETGVRTRSREADGDSPSRVGTPDGWVQREERDPPDAPALPPRVGLPTDSLDRGETVPEFPALGVPTGSRVRGEMAPPAPSPAVRPGSATRVRRPPADPEAGSGGEEPHPVRPVPAEPGAGSVRESRARWGPSASLFRSSHEVRPRS
jgi:hypothetical protein